MSIYMNDSNLQQKINEITLLSDDELTEWYRKNKKDALQIIESVSNLNLRRNRRGRIQFRQACWHYRNSIMYNPICANKDCSNPVAWNDTTHSYQTFCSNKCVHEDGSHNKKRAATVKKRFGVNNIFEDVERIKSARKRKFGVEHANQNSEIREKRKNKFIEKYGVDHPWKNADIRRKCVKSREYQNVTDEQLKFLSDRAWLKEQLVDKNKTQQQIGNEIGVAQSTVGLYANQHNIQWSGRSKIQNQVFDFITSVYNGSDIKTNTKIVLPNHELDIYIPSLQLAIEVNGVFWHGELNGKDRYYHLNKTLECKKQNIRLIHIMDTEWYTQQEIVKSRLLCAINKVKRIYARQCQIRELSTTESRRFFEENHIQGFIGSKMCYGLIHNNTIVGAMSFGMSRFDKVHSYELLRYCSKNQTTIVGGASKLFKHFIKEYNPKTIVSYCDNRWGTGNLYSNLNFECVNENTVPNYYYFKRDEVGRTLEIYSRVKFQKHRLRDKLELFDSSKTEWENMIDNGYDRIWDCGSSKWIWRRD